VGLAIGFVRRRHDRLLHVPAHGHDLLGPESRRSRVEHHIHESPRSMTGPLILLAIRPRCWAWANRLPAGDGPAPPVAGAGLREHDRRQAATRRPPTTSSASTAPWRSGRRLSSPWQSCLPGGSSASRSRSWALRAQPRPDQVREIQRPARPGIALQGLVQPSGGSTTSNNKLFVEWAASSPPPRFWFDRTVVDGTGSTASAPSPPAPAGGFAASRRAGSRTYALGIALRPDPRGRGRGLFLFNPPF